MSGRESQAPCGRSSVSRVGSEPAAGRSTLICRQAVVARCLGAHGGLIPFGEHESPRSPTTAGSARRSRAVLISVSDTSAPV